MDWLRSCYRVPMIFREGDEPVMVRWYFTDEDANCFQGNHVFGSQNWRNERIDQAIGEQIGPRLWVNGSKPTNGYDGNDDSVECYGGVPVERWETGLDMGEESGPYGTNFIPECCVACEVCPPGSGPDSLWVYICVVEQSGIDCVCDIGCINGATFLGTAEKVAPCTYELEAFYCGEPISILLTMEPDPAFLGHLDVEWGADNPTATNSFECLGVNNFQIEFDFNIFELPTCEGSVWRLRFVTP